MRIIYLCLKNFASINTAMMKKKIEIDFTKCKNKVILLVGINGSGKTSIISNLHPFAYPGSMDVRNNEELILDKQDGYKEIHIQDDDNLFIIMHYYLYNKNGRITKSFIKKNGIELNSNGNVNSFKEIVELELGIEPDYLKLIRLGSNVINFINMKASERKNFTTNLLSDLDLYSQFYKKVNSDSKTIKTILNSVINKIEKLKIIDESDIENKIQILQSNLLQNKIKRDNINNSIGKIDGIIYTLIPQGIEEFYSKLKQNKELLNSLKLETKKIKDKMYNTNIIIIGGIDDEINLLNNSDVIINNEIITNNNMTDFYNGQLEKLYSSKEEKENQLKYIASDLEYSKLNRLYIDLNKQKQLLDKKFKGYEPKCTKEDMLNALKLMQEINTIISNIYTFNNDAIYSVIENINNKINIDVMIKNEIDNIDDNLSKLNAELISINNIQGINNKVFILIKPKECKSNNCPYIDYYDETTSKDNSKDKIKMEISKLEKKREILLCMNDINKNIDYILLLIKTNKELINKLPEDFFNIKNLFISIQNDIPFYDENKITNYISIIEDYENYLKIQKDMTEIKKELSFIEKNSSTLTSLQNELCNIENEINNINTSINNMKIKNENLNKLLILSNKRRELYLYYKDLENQYNEKINEYNILIKIVDNDEEIKNKLNIYIENKESLTKEVKKVNNEIEKIENEISDYKFKLKEFKSLSEEKKILDEQFDEIEYLRKSLSSNEGISLLFIQLYFNNSKMKINNLLDIVYKGNLEIYDFKINEKEFKIPYIVNGVKISDIVSASQGESSFVSLALSFGLIEQSITKYNILLLDEIDSALDQKNRSMFLGMLEKILDNIHAEQVFLITHNNMFDNYPIDLILTSNENIDNYKNINIIYSN